MKGHTYESPTVSETCIDMLHFLCTSIQEMELVNEVDEYDNMGETMLNFDNDY